MLARQRDNDKQQFKLPPSSNTVSLRRISFFLEIRSPQSVTPFFCQNAPFPPKSNKTAPAAKSLSACSKTMITAADELWECARKVSIIPFSIFMSMFHQCFTEHRFLESTLELLQQFSFMLNLLQMIIRYFLGINPSSLSSVSIVGKKVIPTELLGKLIFMAPMAISHHLKILSSISPVNDSPLVLKNMPVLFTSTRNYSASKTLFDNAIYEIAGDDADELFHPKKCYTNHDCRVGEFCFCEASKLIWQNQRISIKKIISGKRRINFQAHF
jgi:hypothetical protein